MRVTDKLTGRAVEVSVSSVVSIREYPAGETMVSTSDPSIGVIQATESVDELVSRLHEEMSK